MSEFNQEKKENCSKTTITIITSPLSARTFGSYFDLRGRYSQLSSAYSPREGLRLQMISFVLSLVVSMPAKSRPSLSRLLGWVAEMTWTSISGRVGNEIIELTASTENLLPFCSSPAGWEICGLLWTFARLCVAHLLCAFCLRFPAADYSAGGKLRYSPQLSEAVSFESGVIMIINNTNNNDVLFYVLFQS